MEVYITPSRCIYRKKKVCSIRRTGTGTKRTTIPIVCTASARAPPSALLVSVGVIVPRCVVIVALCVPRGRDYLHPRPGYASALPRSSSARLLGHRIIPNHHFAPPYARLWTGSSVRSERPPPCSRSPHTSSPSTAIPFGGPTFLSTRPGRSPPLHSRPGRYPRPMCPSRSDRRALARTQKEMALEVCATRQLGRPMILPRADRVHRDDSQAHKWPWMASLRKSIEEAAGDTPLTGLSEDG
ncbi:hypothetical protein C8R46DRAFT_331547 [Mycena filopes]|nr:hypothetical protein C8R46DRAFT_331547 [Mycena filopes]